MAKSEQIRGVPAGDRIIQSSDSHPDICAVWGRAGSYRFVGASAIGQMHVERTRSRDDAVAVRVAGPWIAVAVSDGVGSCPKSRWGAACAVDMLCEHLIRVGVLAGSEPSLPQTEARPSLSRPSESPAPVPVAPATATATEPVFARMRAREGGQQPLPRAEPVDARPTPPPASRPEGARPWVRRLEDDTPEKPAEKPGGSSTPERRTPEEPPRRPVRPTATETPPARGSFAGGSRFEREYREKIRHVNPGASGDRPDDGEVGRKGGSVGNDANDKDYYTDDQGWVSPTTPGAATADPSGMAAPGSPSAPLDSPTAPPQPLFASVEERAPLRDSTAPSLEPDGREQAHRRPRTETLEPESPAGTEAGAGEVPAVAATPDIVAHPVLASAGPEPLGAASDFFHVPSEPEPEEAPPAIAPAATIELPRPSAYGTREPLEDFGTLQWFHPSVGRGAPHTREANGRVTAADVTTAFRRTYDGLAAYARSRNTHFDEYACTLLGLLVNTETGQVAVGHVGDGLIAARSAATGLTVPLVAPIRPDNFGEVYPFTRDDWESFFTVRVCDELPPEELDTLFVMTDGVAEDCSGDAALTVWGRDVDAEIRSQPEGATAAARLADWLSNYQRSGSYDDRTLVVVARD